MPATFDGVNLLITLPSATPSIDGQVDLYSDWKEWVKLSDNAKYPPAFDTTGGDPVSPTQNLAPAFFLRNDLGWRIKPAEESANVIIVGNLYARDTTLDLIIPTTGAFTVLVNIDRSQNALVVSAATGTSNFDPTTDLVEGSYTYQQILRGLAAAMMGKVSGQDTNAPKFRDLADAKDRISATTSSDGRLTIILDLS